MNNAHCCDTPKGGGHLGQYRKISKERSAKQKKQNIQTKDIALKILHVGEDVSSSGGGGGGGGGGGLFLWIFLHILFFFFGKLAVFFTRRIRGF